MTVRNVSRIALLLPGVLAFLPPPCEAGRELWRSIRPGMVVEVQGDARPAGGIEAAEVDVRSAGEFGDRDVELAGPLEAFDPGAASARLFGLTMTLAGDCKIECGDAATGPAPVAAGAWVEMDGSLDDEGRIVVKRLKCVAAAAGADLEIQGPVLACDAARGVLDVAGVEVRLKPRTVIRGKDPAFQRREIVVGRAVDDDDSASTRWRLLGDRVRLGGKLSAGVEPERNFDLNEHNPADYTDALWSAELEATARPSAATEMFLKAGLRRQQVLKDEEKDERSSTSRQLQQLYLVARHPAHPWLALQLGRQDFDESREWLYDENLDAARLHALLGPVRTEASVSTRWNTRSRQLAGWTNWMLMNTFEPAPGWEGGAYLIHRRLRGDGGERPTWIGLRSHGKVSSGLRHWAELSALRGTYAGDTARGWAFDTGFRLRLHRGTRTTLSAGIARGSGGHDVGRRYHQTGFHDNNDTYGGVRSFRYYGELVDPELSNLRVLTAGLGIRPTPESSVDLLLHRYDQVTPDRNLGRTSLDMRPLGIRTEIGEELDVVVAIEEFSQVELEYVFAVFRPGAAFPGTATNAYLNKLELQVKF